MRSLVPIALIYACAATAGVACHSAAAPNTLVSLGLVDIDGGSSVAALIVPATGTVGVPTPVTVSTWGSSSCTHPDTTIISVTRLIADITVYDRGEPPETPCTGDLHRFPRDVTVTFLVPGQAAVRLHGRSSSGQTTLSATLTVGL